LASHLDYRWQMNWSSAFEYCNQHVILFNAPIGKEGKGKRLIILVLFVNFWPFKLFSS